MKDSPSGDVHLLYWQGDFFIYAEKTVDRSYITSELELAAFLKTRGHALRGASLDGRLVQFNFSLSASDDAPNYFGGAPASARDLFEAHRSLRALIQQVREHSQQQIGSEKKSHEHPANRR
jgi:hypothetical protein